MARPIRSGILHAQQSSSPRGCSSRCCRRVHRDDPFADRLQDGGLLLDLKGYLMGLQVEDLFLDVHRKEVASRRARRRGQSAQRGAQLQQDRVHSQLHVVHEETDGNHADLPPVRVEDRGFAPDRIAERAGRAR